MANFQLVQVWEQDAIFDGDPDFMPGRLVMNVLNHNAFGGTKRDLSAAREELEKPVRYTVRVKVEVKKLESSHDGE